MTRKNQIPEPIVSKSEQVRRRLRDSIRNGEFEADKPIPSDNDLSTLFGISRNTVREAISSLVSEGLLARIQGKGTFLRSGIFREDPLGTRPVITLMGWDLRGVGKEDFFFNTILRSAHEYLATKGWGMTLRMIRRGESLGQNFKMQGEAATLRNGIVFGSYLVTEEDAKLLEREGIPAVSIGRPGEGALIDYVDADHTAGVAAAVNHLFELGHRRIAFIDSSSYPPAFQDRQASFLRAHKEYGIAVDPGLMVNYAFGDAAAETRVIDALSLSPCRFTALMVYGECATFGAVTALREKGLRIPQDVSVLVLYPPPWVITAFGLELTRLVQSTLELGRRAVELLTNQPEPKTGRRVVIVPTELVIGASCASSSEALARQAVRSG